MRQLLTRQLLDNYYFASAYHSLRWHLAKLQGKEPLIVYQMGKVGSASILESLIAMKSHMPIYHVHYLTYDGISKVEKVNKFRHGTNRYLRKQIDKGLKGKKWEVVTLVREPIIRNISAFFQNIYMKFPDIDYQLKKKNVKISELIEEFLKNYSHDIPLKWFDSEMKRVFGVDVFLSKFPKARGYEIYKGETANVLLLRLENINECAYDAFKDFLNIKMLTLVKANISIKRKYYTAYRKFVDSIVLPPTYIDKMYSSKYAQHFYSEEEINKFKTKWLRSSS